MRANKKIGAVVGVVLLASSLAACTDGSEAATGPSSTEVTSVGLMVQDLGNPFFSSMSNGVEAAAKDLKASFTAQDGRQDLGAQNDQIDAFIQQGIDVILLNAVDSDGIGPAVSRAINAGITVVAVDVGAKNAQATVTTDNVQAGRISCQYLAEEIGGAGDILLVDGTPTTSITDRVEGCNEALAEYPDIKIVGQQNGDNGRDKALTLTTDMITASPNVKAIFGINDPTALGANLAAKQSGLSDLIITGVDGSPEAVKDMTSGGSMFHATAAQDPYLLGTTALDMAVKLRAGEKLSEDLVLVPSTLVDIDNVGEYKGWK